MKALCILCLLLGICASVEAGLVITKKKAVKFGKVTEKKSAVELEVTVGDMTGRTLFKKSEIIYFATHEKVTDYYMGAKYAYKTKNYKIAKFLAENSVKLEPENKEKAEELLIFIEKLNKIKGPTEGDAEVEDDY